MRQGGSTDDLFADAKSNLWQQDAKGNWRIDPERDALRMANHTRVFHRKPTLEESIAAVRKQYYSGEGAIQWAGEAVARANIDLVSTAELKADFLQAYEQGKAGEWLQKHHPNLSEAELEHRLARYGLNPCGEIIGSNFHCNLAEIHLNQIDPDNYKEQEEAFTAGALSVAVLLHHQFIEPRYQYSRELDPIVGVSFTGLFDFFVNAFGVDWLRWWEAGRPETPQGLAFKHKEQEYLTRWKKTVHRVVWEYCDRVTELGITIKRPNRCTTVQPSGTKSLLTGASPGWHPPKAQRFLRRITCRKNDPVALACLDYGYNIIPSQSDKDEQGNLLNDPFDPRCTEWLVEIPVAVAWADLPGADTIDISKFNAMAQMDFYMQVQKYYVTHNTSATIELRENEIETLGTRIYEAIRDNEGYMSAALLARFDDLQTFPRLPFEPISKQKYEQLMQEVESRRQTSDFHGALSRYDLGEMSEAGPAGCDSDKCMMPEVTPN
jgi:ribonucleotide reductase, class II